jgi:guanine deaminase
MPARAPASTANVQAFRGEIVDFVGDPALLGASALRHHADGVLVVRDGRVAALGPAKATLRTLSQEAVVTDYRGKLILPGFVDTHVHYAQTDMIASYGAQLLEWLERYTFPAEARFKDPEHAREVAEFFTDELLRNGTTTAMAFATTHKHSVDAIFEAARRRSMRLIAGKVLMDRNVPKAVRDTAQTGYDDSKALIEAWHGRDRLGYAVTPRFAPTSTERQLDLCGTLLEEHPGVHLQSHVAENRTRSRGSRRSIRGVAATSTFTITTGSLCERAVYAHCIHLDAEDRQRMAATGAAMSFCATSNLFLGSGLFDLAAAHAAGVRVGLGTDIGGGTTLSMLRTMAESYKVCQMAGQTLSPAQAFYLATLGGAASLYLDADIGNFERREGGRFHRARPGGDAASRPPHRPRDDARREAVRPDDPRG